MRVDAKWTPRGIFLWVIAAIAATIAVCYGKPSVSHEKPSGSDPQDSMLEVDFELDEGP